MLLLHQQYQTNFRNGSTTCFYVQRKPFLINKLVALLNHLLHELPFHSNRLLLIFPVLLFLS